MVPYTQSSPQMTSEIISLMDTVYWYLCSIIIISRLRGTLSHHKATLGDQTDSIHCSSIHLSQCVISPYRKTSIRHIGIFFTHDVCYIQWSVDIFCRMSSKWDLKQLHLITRMDKHLCSGQTSVDCIQPQWVNILSGFPQVRDAVAVMQLLLWLEKKVPEGTETELTAAQFVDQCRRYRISSLIPLTHKTHAINNDCSIFRGPRVYLPFNFSVLENQLQDQHYKL